jgi:aconitate hydratase
VVAYALAGSTRIDLTSEPIGQSSDGKPVFLRDIWPSNQAIADEVMKVNEAMFRRQYADVFRGDDNWRQINVDDSLTYPWDEESTYIRNPPYFSLDNSKQLEPVMQARILALFGDSITTDHISPAGAIAVDSPAGRYLLEKGVDRNSFNSYGSRRGNHELMMRGTFANIRIRNEMTPGVEGGVTRFMPGGEQMSIYEAAMKYLQAGTPLVVIAGKEYGTGSSRDWAAKGTRLLGVKAVIAESFERIHRSNLIGMGVLPLQFIDGFDRKQLKLTGAEKVSISGMQKGLQPGQKLELSVTDISGSILSVDVLCRIDTRDEVAYYEAGGILQYSGVSMLITFKTRAYANITMFGDVGRKMLEMMAFGTSVPGAINTGDVPTALANLEAALAKIPQQEETVEDNGAEPPAVGLHTRAVPLLELLQAAIDEETYVSWE